MKYKILSLSILMVSASLSAENSKNLILYKDIAQYSEKSSINLKNETILLLNDSALLDTFNVVILDSKGGMINLNSVEIHEVDENNLFKLNKNKEVFVNGKKYILSENGKGFIKLINEEGLMTFIPKDKIKEIAFSNNVDNNYHIVKIGTPKINKEADILFSYSLGNIDWKPKYNIYIGEERLQLDYNVEISNKTLNSFENVNVFFEQENFTRHYTEFNTYNNDGLFNKEYNIVANYDEGTVNKSNKEGGDNSFLDMEALEVDYNAAYIKKRDSINSFSLNKKINIPSNTKVLYPYIDSKVMNYAKKNTLQVDEIMHIGSTYIPSNTIIINNENGIPINNGIARKFSGKKEEPNKLIGEVSLLKSSEKEDVKIVIGNNYGINVKVKSIAMSEKYMIPISMNIIDALSNKREVKEIYLNIKEITIDIKNIGNEKNISFLSDDLISSSDLEKIKSEISKINNKSDSKENAEIKIEKIKKLLSKEIEVNLNKKNINGYKIYRLSMFNTY